jgi:hypothetical protein
MLIRFYIDHFIHVKKLYLYFIYEYEYLYLYFHSEILVNFISIYGGNYLTRAIFLYMLYVCLNWYMY